jgi:arginase family enzyme
VTSKLGDGLWNAFLITRRSPSASCWADVVEVAPPYDPAGATAVAAANVAYDLIGLMALAAVPERG